MRKYIDNVRHIFVDPRQYSIPNKNAKPTKIIYPNWILLLTRQYNTHKLI